jgi:ketosteroid isomerase-like protein
MPTDHVEFVEGAIAAFSKGDWVTLESFYWPDAEAQAPEGWPEAENARGWPAMRRQFERLKDSWEEDSFEVLSAEDLGEERVFLAGIWHTRGKGSGIEVDLETWVLATLREGRISRIEFYIDREKAMRAAGA